MLRRDVREFYISLWEIKESGCHRGWGVKQDELTCGNEGPLEKVPEVVQVKGGVLYLYIFIAGNSGLYHMQVGQVELVQLLCEVTVGGIWLVIFDTSKLAIR